MAIQVGRISEKPHVVSLVNGSQTVGFSLEVVNKLSKDEDAELTETHPYKVLAFGKIADDALIDLKLGDEVYIKGTVCYQKEDDHGAVTTIIAKEVVSLEPDKGKEDRGEQRELL